MRTDKIEVICTKLRDKINAHKVIGRNFGSAHGIMFMASWPKHSRTVFINDDDIWGHTTDQIVDLLTTKF